MKLNGRHAFITGGGTGIGAAIAEALVAEGARVTLVGRRRDKLEEVAARLRAPAKAGALAGDNAGPATLRPSPERLHVASADVTDRAQVDAAVGAARAAHGPVSILVNNAGASHGVPFAKVTEQLWRDMLAVNLDGVFHCCQAALADLLAAEAGRIVTIASIAGLRGFAYASPYIVAKHGAVGLTRALAADFANTSLRVNAVCPGFVETEMTVQSVANITAKTGRSEGEARAELAKLNRSGRLISSAEVAALTLDLILSDRNGEAVEIA
jgi:NAD(P)-dependent dehydrogenase (short-subunit alcohol dehydrogenase family)